MKKIFLLIALSFLLVPNITQAQESEDIRAEIDELNELLEEIMERIEVLESLLESNDFIDTEDGDEQGSELSPALQLEQELNNLDVTIGNVRYVVQSEDYKTLYPDMLTAVLTNNSDTDIRDITYAFVAWDQNGLPLKIKGSVDFSSGQYMSGATRENVNATPGDSFGHDFGYSLDSDMDNISAMKAIVLEYEGFNGENWQNPLLDDFLEIYEGKRLAEIEDHEDVIYFR